MARAKRTITKDTAAHAYRYLLTALEHPNRSLKFSIPFEDRDKAISSLKQLSMDAGEFLKGFSVYTPKPDELQVWCDKWLATNDMRRMWNALRQQTHKERYKLKRIPLRYDTWLNLSMYAEKKGLTLGEAIDALLQKN